MSIMAGWEAAICLSVSHSLTQQIYVKSGGDPWTSKNKESETVDYMMIL